MRRHPGVTMALVIAALVALAHIPSVRTGLFLDDHAHYQQLRDGDWSYRSIVAAARLGIVGDVMDLWSKHEAGLRFYRPVAFALMRLEYTLVGWRPVGMHVFSVIWDWACAVLVGVLAWRFLGHWGWATVAAGLVAIHPGHVVTVYWIACQTELMATAFVLLATLCYARYAGWWRCAGQRFGQLPGGGPVATPDSAGETQPARTWATAALAFYALAMGCREHAIMWPAVIVVGDWSLRNGWRRRWKIYVLMAVTALAYLLAREEALGGFPLPGRPYLVRPGDAGFFAYVINKFIYYIVGLFSFVPVVPVGGTEYFAQRPVPFYAMFAGAVAVIVLVAWATRPRRWLLIPLTWMTAFFLPLLPVFASSHHLYLPGVGMAIILAAGLAAIAGNGRNPARRLIAGGVVAIHFVGLSALCGFTIGAYAGGTRVEDLVVRDVLKTGGPIREGDHLFFVNVPMLAYYAVPAIENETGVRGLHGHVLTFSPWLLGMQSPGTLKRVGNDTLLVTAPPDEAYFAGPDGRTLLTVMGFERPLKTGDTVDGPLFRAEVLEADDRGVRRLRFTFHQPLDTPGYHFFFGSPVRWAYGLQHWKRD